MLFSIALIFLCGMILGSACKKIGLPPLTGMLATGIILCALNLLDDSVFAVSADLRRIALIIILTRAGLNLDLKALKSVGRSAVMMCFVPACFEIIGTVIIAPLLFDISLIDAAVMGSVLAAVSPAVIVPKMLKLINEGYGNKKGIPQMIMAGASMDDVFVIVLFTAFSGLSSGGSVSAADFVKIPVSIVLGIAVGIICGLILNFLFSSVHMRDSAKVVIILSISFMLAELDNFSFGFVAVSGLVAVMAVSVVIRRKKDEVARRLSAKYEKLWVAAEILLFVLVGAEVDLSYAVSSGLSVIILIFAVLIFRMIGVFLCVAGTGLNKREMLFCMIAYCPKATVQAAIGSLPKMMGLPCGDIVLSAAVLAILITAPLGAFAIEHLYKRLLIRD